MDKVTRAKNILQENSDRLRQVMNRLLEKEVLDAEEVRAIIGLPQESSDAAGDGQSHT